MGQALLGALLGLSGRRRHTWQPKRLGATCCRLFLESLETRALPSYLTATPVLADIGELPSRPATSSVEPESGRLNFLGQGQPGNVGGPSDGLQDDPGGTGGAQIQIEVNVQLKLNLQPIKLLPAQYGKPQGGQNNGQLYPAGDGQSGPGDSSANSPTSVQVNGPGAPGLSPANEQGRQTDSSDNSLADTAAGGFGSPADAPNGPSHCGHHHQTMHSPPEGASDDPKPSGDAGQGGTGTGSRSDGRAGADPAAGPVDNPSPGSVTEGGAAGAAAANSVGSSSDKREHGPSAASMVEEEQHSLLGVQEGKQPGPDSSPAPVDELRTPMLQASQEPELHNRDQPGVPGPQQSAAEDPGQWPRHERLAVAEASQRPAIAAPRSTPGEAAVSVAELPMDTPRSTDLPKLSPQNQELLIDSLSLDFSSLRSEVQRFFEQIDQLGAHATERQIGMVLCSAAVVVAAAMACELAWRHARRPPAPSACGLASPWNCPDETEEASVIRLPDFGQFSALS